MAKRINSIDILRIISAFAIVLIHGYGENAYINAVCRFAVPMFFMISGYFYCVPKKKQKFRIKKIFILTIIANLSYFCFALLRAFLKGNTVSFLAEVFTFKNIIVLVLFNEPRFGDFGNHLWFLSALLYCMIIDYFVYGFLAKRKKCFTAVILSLFIGYFVIERCGLMLLDLDFSVLFVRNFLFFGLPYFWIGKLLKNLDVSKIKIKNYMLIMFICLFFILTLAEAYISITYFDFYTARDQYLFTAFFALSVFILALKNPLENPGRITGIIALSGRKYSLGIYIFHPIVLAYIVSGAAVFGITLENPFRVVAAFVITLLIVALYYFAKEKICLLYRSRKSELF